MTLSPGTRWGHYEVLSPLGVGGMGEVYRARDTRLRRDVAIKALPQDLAANPERLARLEREARILASLNHPNIAAIYGLEESEGSRFLVMECVEGESLAHHLAAGPLPVEEALPVAAQIASGLEAAHEAGVIHRDLKPANVMLRPDGSVKILDLGLARTFDGSPSADPSLSPTMTSPVTGAGFILGTAAYMSPEQARGKALDKRTDIFSFGCVLYECLTGQHAFPGDNVSDILASILRSEPDWSALPTQTPAAVRKLLRRCLEKDRRRRLHDIGDARIEIEDAMSAPAEVGTEVVDRVPPRKQGAFLWGLISLTVGAAVAFAISRALSQKPITAPPSVRAVLPLPPDTRLSLPGSLVPASPSGPGIALSPDGRTVVFRGTKQGAVQLYRRRLDRDEAEPIAGTENAFAPFFSPDGEWLGFFTRRELKKVPVEGGASVRISFAPPITAGGAWGSDGSIVFNRTINAGLFRVPAAGGEPRPLTTLDPARGEHAHLWPQILPEERGILVSIVLGQDFQDHENSQIAVIEPKSGRRKVVLEGSTFARYAAGWLVFVRGGAVFAAPFDLASLRVTGPAVLAPGSIAVYPADGSAHFAVSSRGDLAYASGLPVSTATSRVLRIDRDGRETPLPLPPAFYFGPRLAPDGQRLALGKCEKGFCKVFIYDLARQILSPLTPEPGRFFSPAWSPDGTRLAVTQLHTTFPKVVLTAADGSGSPAARPWTPDSEFANSFSPDGRIVSFTVVYVENRGTRTRLTSDIWLAPLDGKEQAHPWFETPFREGAAAFSPDGRWGAYVSSESGRSEVYVRPFPGPGGKVKVSSDGGAEPVWTKGGRELLYREGKRVLSVDIVPGTSVSISRPRLVFEKDLTAGKWEEGTFWEFDANSDGTVFYATRLDSSDEPDHQLAFVTNWLGTLPRASAPQ